MCHYAVEFLFVPVDPLSIFLCFALCIARLINEDHIKTPVTAGFSLGLVNESFERILEMERE